MPTKGINEFDILLNLFEQAETKIKNVEQITSEGVLIPSINQLRYAGHHIVRSLLSDDAKERQAKRVKAINHLTKFDKCNLMPFYKQFQYRHLRRLKH
jgi:hypothetical protein